MKNLFLIAILALGGLFFAEGASGAFVDKNPEDKIEHEHLVNDLKVDVISFTAESKVVASDSFEVVKSKTLVAKQTKEKDSKDKIVGINSSFEFDPELPDKYGRSVYLYKDLYKSKLLYANLSPHIKSYTITWPSRC